MSETPSFYTEQENHKSINYHDISEVENDYGLYIKQYLKLDYNSGIDQGLVDIIEARGDQDKVLNYLDYQLDNNPNNLSKDDLSQLAILTKALSKIDRNHLSRSIESQNNIDFEIVGGTIRTKVYVLGRGTEIREYPIVDEKIVNLGNNKYRFILKRENSSIEYKFEIKYNGGHSMVVYDQFGRFISRAVIETKEKVVVQGGRFRKEIFKTPGTLTINTHKEKIKVNLMFND